MVPYQNTAHSTGISTDVDTLKFRLVYYDTLYNGQIQQVPKNILSATYVDWDLSHLILVVCYILHLLTPLSSMQELIMPGMQ